jgi:hypothetical protein
VPIAGRSYAGETMKRRHIVLIVLSIPLLIALGAWVHRSLAYLQIESLTALHAAELAPIVVSEAEFDSIRGDTTFRSRLDYFKVFSNEPPYASVFVVTTTKFENVKTGVVVQSRLGKMYHVRMAPTGWMLLRDSGTYSVWDDMGSLDNDTWPPYR